MDVKALVRAIGTAAVAALFTPPAPALAAPPSVDLNNWTAPAVDSLGDDAFGKLAKYGYALITDTANQIGPGAADPAKRYAGNGLTCQNCHLRAATMANAVPLVGSWGQFPQYRPREGEVGTYEERVNGCMERSMNGRALPLDSREMKAFLAYVKFISTGVPDGAKLAGAGLLPIKAPDRAVDLDRGAKLFAQNCAACHGADGQGQRAASGAGYQTPPLWGADSYNDGAGMTRVLEAAAFAKYVMPPGTTVASAFLSDDDAYDIAGFVDSHSRPHKANLANDFPNRLQKPADTPYGPYVDGFSDAQHKAGPFGPIQAKLKSLAAQSH